MEQIYIKMTSTRMYKNQYLLRSTRKQKDSCPGQTIKTRSSASCGQESQCVTLCVYMVIHCVYIEKKNT